MEDQVKKDFLRKRMIELREKNNMKQSDMAELLHCNKSTLSRAEKVGGDTSYKTVLGFAIDYCDKLGLTEKQKELFLRGEKIVVVDTSALLKNTQLIDELGKEYNRVIVPQIVINELDNIKDHSSREMAQKAWQLLKSIGASAMAYPCPKREDGENNDSLIIKAAANAAEEFKSEVDLISYDAGFLARLSGNNTIHALYLEEYVRTKQGLINIGDLKNIDAYYADDYQNAPEIDREVVNAYLPNGVTLIISAVRNNKATLEQRKKKILWLIENGADVNKRDCSKYYFPPLSHAVQKNDFEMFKFLLHECGADPNIGSRNPYDAGKIRQKNDGNMPLMIAAWDNKKDFVRELCNDPRTSLNQQDGNGFTALIKACYWGWLETRDILIEAGADQKIVDRDGYTAEGRYNEYLETGRRKSDNFRHRGKNEKRGYGKRT